MDAKVAESAGKHTIPVIDRMMEVLVDLERHAGGRTIRELTEALGVPRTTVYRILNTLQGHEVVRRGEDGTYHLGVRLLSLAAHVSTRVGAANLAAVAQPHLDRLAAELGEGVKLSLLDRDEALVLAAAQGRRDYALTVSAGQRMPLHSGAAGKMILSHQAPEVVEGWLAGPLPAYTSATITDPSALRAELERIRRQGWSQDRGEAGPSIHAFAAPVLGPDGTLTAALSVPFLAGAGEARMAEIREAAVRAARAIGEALKG
jgi:DNA-binding IclR family transcriptional regulator